MTSTLRPAIFRKATGIFEPHEHGIGVRRPARRIPPVCIGTGIQDPVHFLFQNASDGLDGLFPRLVQLSPPLDSGDAFGRRDFGDDKTGRGFGRILLRRFGRAFQIAPVDRDGGIEAGEGPFPFAAREKERKTKSDRIPLAGFRSRP